MTITPDAFLGTSFVGRVSNISLQADKRPHWGRSAYYQLTITFDQPDSIEIKPGMSLRVHVPLADGEMAS